MPISYWWIRTNRLRSGPPILQQRHKISPYIGSTFRGMVRRTIRARRNNFRGRTDCPLRQKAGSCVPPLITAGPFTFTGRLETARAPLTCAAFLKLLPFKENLLHVRWSGESTWVPLGNLAVAFLRKTQRCIRCPVKFFCILAASARRRS